MPLLNILGGEMSAVGPRPERPEFVEEIAELACHIEIEELGMPIGKQDHYAASFGGLNFISFASKKKEGVTVEPLRISSETLHRLQRNTLLFFTRTARDSAEILTEQKKSSQEDDPGVIDALHAVKEAALEVKKCFERGDLRRLGELLDLNWQHKKRFASGVTNPFIDECYELSLANGALGGKIAGAGGGGFLMLYCEEERQGQVTKALEEKGLKRIGFHFEASGARVLMNAGLRITRGRT